MKSLFTTFLFAIGIVINANAQCVPVSQASPGFSPKPDSISCYVIGQTVSGTGTAIYFKNYDLLAGLTVEYLSFDSITNLPTGMAYTFNNPLGTQYLNSETGCINFSGVPTSGCGQYRLGVYVRLKLQGLPVIKGEFGDIAKMIGVPNSFAYILRVRSSTENCPCVQYTPANNTDSVGVTKPGRKACIPGATQCTGTPVNNLSVNVGGIGYACTGGNVTLTPAAANGTAPYIYQWAVTTGNALSCTACQNPTAIITQNSSYSLTVTDAAGLTVTAQKIYYLRGMDTASIYGNITNSLCQGQYTTLSTTDTFSTYRWSTGDTSRVITVSTQGQYSVIVTRSAPACIDTASIFITVYNKHNHPITGSTSITPSTAYPYSVTNYPGTTYNWYISGGTVQSGQGTSNVSILWNASGPYGITMLDTYGAGCNDTTTLLVTANTCNLVYNVNVTGSTTPCAGDTTLLVAQAGSPYSYAWIKTGVTIATGDTLRVTESGSYQLQVSSGSCTAVSNNYVISFKLNPPAPTISQTGNSSCIANVSLSAGAGYTTYLWSTGGNSDSIHVNVSGAYTVTVTDTSGCTSISAPFQVNLSFINAYQICAVTVDSITGYNTIAWEKPVKTGVDSFYIYKESAQLNVYDRIGAVGVDDLSIFTDVNSDAQQESVRYKIAAKDTCGNTALGGNVHKTILLTTAQDSGGGVWNLTWTHYVGFTFPTYNIYRGTSSTNLQLIATVSSGTNNYIDSASTSPISFYQIEAVNPNGCIPTAKTANFSSSKSNIARAAINGISNAMQNEKWAVYPNPTSEMVVLAEIANTNVEGYSVKVTNAIGQVIINKPLMNRETKLSAKEWGNGGIYFFHVLDKENRIIAVKKVIVQ